MSPAAGGARLRPAQVGDVAQIQLLLDAYAEMGNLLPRSADEIYNHLRDFFVADVDGDVAACGALEIFTEELGEVRSLITAPTHTGQGLGTQVVRRILEEGRAMGLKRIMALTYVPEYFHKLGFHTVSKDDLPEKVWGICVRCYKFEKCDEIAVLHTL